MRALLDINVLIALHDQDHIHHQRASTWLGDNIHSGWASCALTQNGFLRIMSQPGYPNPQTLGVLLAMLQQSTRTAFHAWWPDEVSLLDGERFMHAHMHSPAQLTDIYLLGLAVHHQARFVSFDRRIPLSAVHGATAEHFVQL